MPLDNPKAGLSAAGEFQSSALPYVTSSMAPALSSVQQIDLPKVSRFLTIANNGSAGQYLRIAFTQNGILNSGYHYRLNGGADVTLELRVKTVVS